MEHCTFDIYVFKLKDVSFASCHNVYIEVCDTVYFKILSWLVMYRTLVIDECGVRKYKRNVMKYTKQPSYKWVS